MFARLLKRIGRGIIAVAIAGVTAEATSKPEYLAVAPAMMGVGKLIREKWNWHWLPF